MQGIQVGWVRSIGTPPEKINLTAVCAQDMASDCQQCREVLFKPGSDQLGSDKGLDDFEAMIHPDVATLKACAKQRSCQLCVVLYGMLEHRRQFGPAERQSPSLMGQYPKICLSLHFGGYEESDEWDFFEDSRHIEDTPKDIVFSHPLGTDEICIRNPQVIARSAWNVEETKSSPKMDAKVIALQAAPHPSPTNHSTGSEEAFALARLWIDKCTRGHDNCEKRSSSTRRIPRRLLDVSQVVDTTNGAVRVINSAEHIAKRSNQMRYVTLSHRWNPTYNCFTLESNIHKHEAQGIEMIHLPKTFAEACVTVKKLGLVYVWIDSLCIIQDSGADKAQEIPNMADYYQNAELNLSASSQSIAGLWSDRDGEATKPFKINAVLDLPRGRKQVDLELAPVLRADKSHLDYRGWILQERIFPRRTLFFDPYWISFECSQMSASESCPEGMELTASSNPVTVETVMGTQLDRDCSLTIIGGIIRSVDSMSLTTGLGESLLLRQIKPPAETEHNAQPPGDKCSRSGTEFLTNIPSGSSPSSQTA